MKIILKNICVVALLLFCCGEFTPLQCQTKDFSSSIYKRKNANTRREADRQKYGDYYFTPSYHCDTASLSKKFHGMMKKYKAYSSFSSSSTYYSFNIGWYGGCYGGWWGPYSYWNSWYDPWWGWGWGGCWPYGPYPGWGWGGCWPYGPYPGWGWGGWGWGPYRPYPGWYVPYRPYYRVEYTPTYRRESPMGGGSGYYRHNGYGGSVHYNPAQDSPSYRHTSPSGPTYSPGSSSTFRREAGGSYSAPSSGFSGGGGGSVGGFSGGGSSMGGGSYRR